MYAQIYVCRVAFEEYRVRSGTRATLLDEAYWLTKLMHESIVKLTHWEENVSGLVLMMEFVPGVNLLTYVLDSLMVEGEVRELALQLCRLVQYLQLNQVAHRDVKPDNLMMRSAVSDSFAVVLVDFGLVRSCSALGGCCTLCGTPVYMAPEVVSIGGMSRILRTSRSYGWKCDVWSVGVLLHAAVSGTLPYDTVVCQGIHFQSEHILRAGPQFHEAQWYFCSMECRDVIRSMMCVSPIARPSSATLLEKSWVRGTSLF